ncbi:MAG: O-antigen ligase family protein, partial [Planctomycetota bacterium]|nr:O-antigen ligase family protein [Planctomycetota bacterium]
MAKRNKNELKREHRKSLGAESSSDGLNSVSNAPRIRVALESMTLGLFVAAPLVPEGTPEQFTNWFPFFLWLLVAAILVGQKLMNREFSFHFSKIDACVYATCFWIVLSGILAVSLGWGHARPTINASWQWFGFAVVFFVIRQLSSRRSFRIAVFYCLVVVAVGCSVSGMYQQFIIYPEMRRNYEKQTEVQKQELIRKAGLNNVEPGSPARMMWENRLSATEPTSTFVLANSLAAFLTPALVVGLALLINGFATGKKIIIWTFSAALISIFICLILTKSRTSYLAALIGGGGLLWVNFQKSEQKMPLKWVMSAVGVCVLIVAIVIAAGTVDIQVFSESAKSLLYRLEYWQSSLDLILDNFWFGCAPGNFQHSYAKYQLVQSSETVADPHNFFMEIWSIGGTPAALFLLMGGGCWLLQFASCETRGGATDGEFQHSVANEIGATKHLPGFLTAAILIGIAIGFLATFLNSMATGLVTISALVFLGMAVSSWKLPKNSRGISDQCYYRAVNFALMTLLIALSASGGVGIPGVATVGIVLFAISLSQFGPDTFTRFESFHASRFNPRQACLVGQLVLAVVAVFFFRATVFDPIQTARRHYRIGELEAMNSRFEPAMESLEKA